MTTRKTDGSEWTAATRCFIHSQRIRLNTLIRFSQHGPVKRKIKKKESRLFQFLFLRLWSTLDIDDAHQAVRPYHSQLNIILHNSKYHNEQMTADLRQHFVMFRNNSPNFAAVSIIFKTLVCVDFLSHGIQKIYFRLQQYKYFCLFLPHMRLSVVVKHFF